MVNLAPKNGKFPCIFPVKQGNRREGFAADCPHRQSAWAQRLRGLWIFLLNIWPRAAGPGVGTRCIFHAIENVGSNCPRGFSSPSGLSPPGPDRLQGRLSSRSCRLQTRGDRGGVKIDQKVGQCRSRRFPIQLGLLYYRGQGIRKSVKEAVLW